ncbi:protein argonaute 4a [Nicotiana attenuata]|uniref:Protein argonaute 4a n=1 Tax=Nicotiana attenuata TaxID=49451 RepID=A0A314KRH5_NICAT|nr:protein argonaute 4a [Nicotiana attenuata]
MIKLSWMYSDGVSESQFNQVINIELDQIIEACNHLDENWFPKLTVVVAQKNHHTKFFQTNSADNVLPADDMQELVHSLSYVYQRSTTAISVVAPICYAHLAAAQMSQFIKFDELSETSSSHGGVTAVGGAPVPTLPRLHRNVRSSMFFC